MLRTLLFLVALGAILTVLPDLSAGETYAFLVAVGDYDVKHLKRLKYTRNDILQLHEVLLAAGVKKQNIVLMHDDSEEFVGRRFFPEAEKIRRELDLLLVGLERDDTIIVAFSGHGVQFQGEKTSYFCPADANLDDPAHKRLISFVEIYAQLKDCPAERKLLLVDACRNDPLSALAKSREQVRLETVTRPQTETVPQGIVALFSCAAGQQSYEWPGFEHGVFFYHVLEALRGKADDGDEELTLDEFVYFTKKQTFSFARTKLAARQTPEFKGEFSGRWVLRSFGNAKPTLLVAPFHEREAKAKQQEWAEYLGQPSPTITNSSGMQLTIIPPGEFQMGSPETGSTIGDSEQQHRVRITQPFLLGQHEVTRGQFARFVQESGYKTDAERGVGGTRWNDSTGRSEGRDRSYNWKNPGFSQTDAHPVVNVSWNDASAFCEWLSRKEGRTYRLPTEAEWEFACRAGTTTLYQSGDNAEDLVRLANVLDLTHQEKDSDSPAISATDGFAFTSPVGSFRPNAFDLFDMHGNAWEYCVDWFASDYYANSPVEDPQGPSSGRSRVIRGGGWRAIAWWYRSATRGRVTPDRPGFSQGFRVVCEVK